MAAIQTFGALFTFILYTFHSVVALSASAPVEANSFGFSIDLIHRDSPKSRFYNASGTPSWWVNVLRTSANRVAHFRQACIPLDSATSPLYAGDAHGTYLMEISIGTPPLPTTLVVDTASNLVWTNCQPCPHCFRQYTPLFDPMASLTYRNLSCDSQLCQFLMQPHCESGSCYYISQFGDESSSSGFLATDTVTLYSTYGQPVVLENTPIGCARKSYGNFDGSGIAALGKGPLSLMSKLGSLVGGKFSYCLVPHFSEHSAKLNFGNEAVVSGPGVISTPLNSQDPNNYNFALEGITIEGKRIGATDPWDPSKKGTIFIDSGTTLTVLPDKVYRMLEAEVREFVHVKPVEIDYNQPTGFSLCYQGNTVSRIPRITMHFTDADIELEPMNIFTVLPNNLVCFAFTGTMDDFAVYGNTQQINFLVGYNLQSQTLSFKKTDCTAYSY